MKKWLFDKIKLFIVSFWGVWVGISLAKEQYPDYFIGSSPDDEKTQKESHRNNRVIAMFVIVFIFVYVSMLGGYFISVNRH